ncbi:MAG: hypothetical protein QME66_04735 [Candidatus Eisenbacteria bacterium]|nr:hypothetical protein [Candidatus Eisenbacteria bacterium]
MGFDAITTTELARGKPFKTGLAKKFRNRDDALLVLVDSGNLLSLGVPNPSFEIDTDADGKPNCWTFAAYPGGSGVLVSDGMHGAKRFRFTHPGGSGNGGGTLVSNVVPATELTRQYVGFCMYASVTGIGVAVLVNCYNASLSFISAASLYDTTAVPTTATLFMRSFVPPAGTRFMAIVLVGGRNTIDVAGYVYFDFVSLNALRENGSDWTIAEGTGTETDWTDKTSTTLYVPDLSGAIVLLTFPASVKTSNSAVTGYVRFRVGSNYSSEIAVAGLPYSEQICQMVLPLTGASATIMMQIKIPAGGATVYGIKNIARSSLIILP